MKTVHILAPLMIMTSGAFMAVAWLGHLRMREWSFWTALAMSWSLVLPEYVLNVAATRYGFGAFTGSQMAAIHLVSGVLCMGLVSHFALGEPVTARNFGGLALVAMGLVLLMNPGR